MKSILSMSVVAMLATLLLAGCGQKNYDGSDSSTNSPATNSSMGEAGGVTGVNTNLPVVNSVPNMNTNLPAGTNQ